MHSFSNVFIFDSFRVLNSLFYFTLFLSEFIIYKIK